MRPDQISYLVILILIFGIIILPLVNRWQFKQLPDDQKVLTIMKQANKLVYWKNVSDGRTGNLFFVKNKRKILVYPWYIDDRGRMVITKKNPFDHWDYPEDKAPLSEEEIKQARAELYAYSKKSSVKIIFNDPFKENKAE